MTGWRKELVEIGVMGMGISIDSLDPQKHNTFRGVPGAWEGAVAGIEACKRNGLQFQVHFSAQPMNYRELPDGVDWAHGLGARVLNVFFMVCTGRGEELTDITPRNTKKCSATSSIARTTIKICSCGPDAPRISNGWPTKRIRILPLPKPQVTWAAAAWPEPIMRE